jgi:hypothetical protein
LIVGPLGFLYAFKTKLFDRLAPLGVEQAVEIAV